MTDCRLDVLCIGNAIVDIIADANDAFLDREGLKSKIIIGSVRHLMDVNEALQDGAHIVTVPPPILRKMLWNPRTESTIFEFNEAWRKRGDQ